uniref:Uncharacterized protein n=1 Tax=Acrobeloides nanus TaxID=290746 RepID=A0A914EKL6_9BILA
MVAFILCKLIAPLRYLSSIIGIRYTVSFLKKRNWLKTSKETSLHLREIHHSATIGARERIQKLRRNLNGSSLRKASDKRRTSLPKD